MPPLPSTVLAARIEATTSGSSLGSAPSAIAATTACISSSVQEIVTTLMPLWPTGLPLRIYRAPGTSVLGVADPGFALFLCWSARTPAGVRDGTLQLVLPPTHDIAVAAHHGVEARAGDIRGIILLRLPDPAYPCMSARSKNSRIGRAWHRACDGHARVLQFGAQGEGEEVGEGLCACCRPPLYVPGMRPAIEPAIRMRPSTWRRPCPPDPLQQVDRAGNVRIDHVPDLIEVLVQERVTQAVARIGQQRVN